MARRTEDFRGLTQPSRMRLLAAVQEQPGLLLRELSERTGLHENTVRDHLLVLENEGLVARQTLRSGTRGRPPETYHPVREPHNNAEADRRIDQAVRNGELLRRMGRVPANETLPPEALAQLDALYEHLDDSGFEPEVDDEALEIDLEPCPFNTLVDGEQDFVCQVHSQLIRDTLTQVPGPLQLELLEPHMRHDRCRVHLRILQARSASDEPPANDEPSAGAASALT